MPSGVCPNSSADSDGDAETRQFADLHVVMGQCGVDALRRTMHTPRVHAPHGQDACGRATGGVGCARRRSKSRRRAVRSAQSRGTSASQRRSPLAISSKRSDAHAVSCSVLVVVASSRETVQSVPFAAQKVRRPEGVDGACWCSAGRIRYLQKMVVTPSRLTKDAEGRIVVSTAASEWVGDRTASQSGPNGAVAQLWSRVPRQMSHAGAGKWSAGDVSFIGLTRRLIAVRSAGDIACADTGSEHRQRTPRAQRARKRAAT